jgi:starvation-inducible DNA-binding protein
MNTLSTALCALLADTYALYLKTQNYHWHVTGVQFKTLHELFETQYLELAAAVDLLAERIIMKGNKAPATFAEFEKLSRIKAGDSNLTANQMVMDLADDHALMIEELNRVFIQASDERDEGSVNVLGDRIVSHEKTRWMLNASRER